MSQFTEVQLEHLKSRLLPFGAEWTGETGRRLATVRDGVDFLAAMKGRDDFWAALAPPDDSSPYPLDLTALRGLLPTGALDSEGAAENYLLSIGLDEDETRAVVTGLDESDFLDAAIKAAFAERRPQNIARALERILETNSDILATQQYVGRVPESRVVARAVSAMMGIALLLVGTACPPQSNTSAPSPPASAQTAPSPAPTPSPAPAPSPNSAPMPPATDTAPAPTPAPVVSGTTPGPTPAPTPAPAPQPTSRPNRPPVAMPRYKGVSPRARAAKSSATPEREPPA